MKKSEVVDYLVINELLKEKTFSSLKKQSIKNKINKLIDTKGTYENNLFELYSMYYEEEEDNDLKNDLANRILKFIPNDFDIKSDLIYDANQSTVIKIKKLEELEKECIKQLEKVEIPLDGKEDIFNFIEGREYIRLLDKIAVLYLELNKKEEYIKICEKILFLNPMDSLSVLDSLSLMYFNKKEYSKIQSLYSKHQNNLILQTLDYVIKFYENKDVKKEMNALLKRNHYIVYYFANFLDIRQKALDRLGNFKFFPYGSLEETLLALLDIENTLDDEALEMYMKAFLSYKGNEIYDFLSEDEINAMCIIIDESNTYEKDPTKEKIYKIFDEKNKKAKLENREYIPNNDKAYLEKMLDTMVDKHLIEIDGVKVKLSLGGIMHMYTIMGGKDNSEEDETIEEEDVLIS